MFKPVATRFLQHITNQNNWSRKYLTAFSGKIIQFNIAFIKTNLLVLEDGSLAIAGNTATPEATVHIPPSLALRLLAQDEAAKMQIKIDGDVHLARELGKVLPLMRWDIEEDLSKLVGDIPANKMIATGKKALHETKAQTINMAEMLAEYWQEERPILTKKRHVEQFNNAVDVLRSDTARLEKRLEKLTSSTLESSTS